ncbi:hypothetical protein AX16_008624 [Volvariella volvacea WC 439]|nr:hypothetical protein AX16_008624 [Volvariella volvacea WC 439]
MLHINELPPEVLARAFEIGILTDGVTYIPPLCLVCKTWYEIVESTPRLWGIISIDKSTNLTLLDQQITKAKASPISLYVKPNVYVRPQFVSALPIARLASLSRNWIYADVPTKVLAACLWKDLRANLQELRLSSSDVDYDKDVISQFFAGDDSSIKLPPKLRAFAGINLPAQWIAPFIGAHTGSLELAYRGALSTLTEITQHLSRAPNTYTLKLCNFRAESYAEDLPHVHLPNLRTLYVSCIEHPAHLTSHIQAPNLQTLQIEEEPRVFGYTARENPFFRGHLDTSLGSLNCLFSQWSQPSFLPVNLRNLELVEVLQVDDIPYLVRWLSRLPNLLRLTLRGDAIGAAAVLPGAAGEEYNIFKALSSSSPMLCPELLELRIETGLVLADLTPIAQLRGCNASTSTPGTLRFIEAPICPSEGEARDVDLLRSLVEEIVCGCLACSFALVTLM